MMVQSAVRDEEDVAARDLAIDDAAHVDAGLADEVAPQLDDELRLRQSRVARSARVVRRAAPIGAEIERLLARESTGCRSRRRG